MTSVFNSSWKKDTSETQRVKRKDKVSFTKTSWTTAKNAKLSQSIVSVLLLKSDVRWETNPRFLNTKIWRPCSPRLYRASTMCSQHQCKRLALLRKSWTVHHPSLHSLLYAIIRSIFLLFIHSTYPTLSSVWGIQNKWVAIPAIRSPSLEERQVRT